ncbi:MAG: prepilin-type N-terminal cleavage/methylation domain-containing protein [Labilithrix sp.]|nr:prepilin-type N-terminal cleavage/methylation domain-containing protein [Labilithrix sp.]
MKRRSKSRGYTAVEVLSALTLFAIGAAGVIGMQRVTVQGGEDARRFDIANNLANEWVARLHRDSVRWTEPNTYSPLTSNLNQTQWLQFVTGCSVNFCTPPMPGAGAQAGSSPAFDLFGRDLPQPAPHDNQAIYCAQYRLNWIANPGVAPILQTAPLLRAEVRIMWSRLELAPIGDCTSLPHDPDALDASQFYHMVYATTTIRENMLR